MSLEHIHDPTVLLFEEPLSLEGGSLFATQLELAQAIKKLPHVDFSSRKEESIRAYLSQVLQPGTSSRSRPLSKSLKDAIIEASKTRLNKEIDFSHFSEVLESSFTRLKNIEFPTLASEMFDKMRESSAVAHHCVIFTLQPAEINASEYANVLRKEMISNLFLNNNLTNNANQLDKIRKKYQFFLPSDEVGIRFWQRLHEDLSRNYSPANASEKSKSVNASEKLKSVDADNSPSLSVFSVSPRDCYSSMLILDPDDQSNRRAFHFHYEKVSDKDQISVAKLSSDAVYHWFTGVYSPYMLRIYSPKSFKDEKDCYKVKRIRWRDVDPEENNELGKNNE